jgi:hypothetical protein
MINVSKHDIGEKCLHLSRRKNDLWMESLLDALAGDNCKTDQAAGWVSMYRGQHHKEEAVAVANKLSLGPNTQMNDVTFQAVATDINASVSTHRGINRNINDFFVKRMFETDRALKARIESRVEKYVRGKFEFTQVTAYPKCVNSKDDYSRESEKVSYRYRDPSQCVARYIAGQVADDLQKDGRTIITLYVINSKAWRF